MDPRGSFLRRFLQVALLLKRFLEVMLQFLNRFLEVAL
jgi:hypothetical protein